MSDFFLSHYTAELCHYIMRRIAGFLVYVHYPIDQRITLSQSFIYFFDPSCSIICSSIAQNQLLGRALLESIVFMNGKCIVSAIDKKTLDFYNAASKDLEGIVNLDFSQSSAINRSMLPSTAYVRSISSKHLMQLKISACGLWQS